MASVPAGDDRPPMVDRDLFIAVTSHELRTPVTVIKGFADTLVEHWDALDPAGRRAAVRVIGQRANELARLVDRLLAATTEPAGALIPAPFDLVGALDEAVGGLGTELRDRLRVLLPPVLPKAYGHRNTLATVLTELITNATRYSPDAEPVELSAGADERHVLFQVADRGTGIAPQHVDRAFTPHWQAGADDGPEGTDNVRGPEGAGLGLYLVRQVVERQRGQVCLRPRDNGGTVAEVRLPRADLMVGAVHPVSEEADGDDGGGGRA